MTRNQIAFAVLCFLFALSLVFMAPAFAQSTSQCGPRDKFIKFFKDKYNESGTSIAGVNETSVLEVYQSPGGETWTIVVSQSDGMSCIIAAGKDWMTKPAEIPGRDS